MKFKTVPHGEIMVLEMSGKIMGGPDHDRFKAEIKDLIDKGFSKVVLDFSGVPWLNSTGLGILISGYHSLRVAEGGMKICNVKERVLSIFYVARLNEVFEVYGSLDEAVASFEK